MSTNTATKPSVMVIVKRYDEPLKYGLHHFIWRSCKFATKERYHEDTPRLVSITDAFAVISELDRNGYETVFEWGKVENETLFNSEEMQHLIQRSLPIEFHNQFQSGDRVVMNRILVLMQGEIETPAYGQCTSCGAIEVKLNRVDGHKDLSAIGEHPEYPYGYGCELCD